MIHGKREDCMAAMGVAYRTFYHYVSRNNTGTQCKYDIYVDEEDDEDE